MNKQTAGTLVGLLLLSGCASLPPREQRTVEYIEPVKAKKLEAYNAALAYFGKMIKDSSSSFKVQNAEAGQIVLKANVECNVFRQFGDVNPYSLAFDLDLMTKDDKVKMSFEDLAIVDQAGHPVQWASNQITDSEKLEKAKSCLQPVREGVVRSIASQKSKTDW